MAGNSRLIAILCHVLILGLAFGLFTMRQGKELPAQRQEYMEQCEAANLASARLPPAVGGVYTPELYRQATELLENSYSLQIQSAGLSRSFFERTAAWSGSAVFLVLIALFLVVRNHRMSRLLRLSIFAFHGLALLSLAILFGSSVFLGQANSKIENARISPAVRDFETTGRAQIGKVYTVRRHEVLFELLETTRGNTGNILDLWEEGEKMLVASPLSLAAITVLNGVLIALLRRPPQEAPDENTGSRAM